MSGPCGNLPRIPPADKTVTVLLVSPHRVDHDQLQAIFTHSNWHVYGSLNLEEAVNFLQKHQVSVVVCEAMLEDGSWKKLLETLPLLPPPPLLIVTSYHADDSLWAEVLNLGAYDVLSKPFDKTEVVRVISLAWLHWRDELLQAVRKPVKTAAETRPAKSAVA